MYECESAIKEGHNCKQCCADCFAIGRCDDACVTALAGESSRCQQLVSEVEKMASAKKCDRCGKLFERMFVPDIKILKYRHPYGEDRIDLCFELLLAIIT